MFLAKILRKILQLALLVIVTRTVVGIIMIYSITPRNKDGNMRHYNTVKFSAKIIVPGSVQTYQSDRGTVAYYAYTKIGANQNIYEDDHQYKRKDFIRNQLKVVQNSKQSISVFSQSISSKEMTLLLNYKNPVYNFFWGATHQLDYLIYISFTIIIFMLLGAYIKGDFIQPKSFKLISLMGILLLVKEVVSLFCSYVNSQIIPSIRLFSTINGGYYKDIDLSFWSIDFINFPNIFLGVIVILLSEIIRNAVILKQENALTI